MSAMIYLFYVEDGDGAVDIQRCRDEVHYMDLLAEVESKQVLIPYDIRWHGADTLAAMRILAVSESGEDLSTRADEIVQTCSQWARQN